jgi:putative chitinase
MNEGLRDTLGGLALGASVALGGGAQANVEKIQVTPGQTLYGIAQQMDTSVEAIKKANKLTSNNINVGQTLIIPNQETVSKEKFGALNLNVAPVTGTPLEKFIMKKAKSAGIRGVQLAAFLSQMSHETGGFKSFTEYGNKSYFNRYDIRYDREKALELGNTRPGDGYKYRGRGYVHLTGKYNYRDATKFLNKNGMPSVNLVKNPDLAANPEIAAIIAVWWWETRTQRKVDNWADVKKVTSTINPSLNGLEDRQNKFKQYLVAMK